MAQFGRYMIACNPAALSCMHKFIMQPGSSILLKFKSCIAILGAHFTGIKEERPLGVIS
jgi:hypothetical protein